MKKLSNLLENPQEEFIRCESIEDSRSSSSLLTWREIFINCFSESITLNAGQHKKAKTKSFSDIYTTKTTLKKFNFYVRENRQQGEEEIVFDAILGRGYTRAFVGREREASLGKKKNASKFIISTMGLQQFGELDIEAIELLEKRVCGEKCIEKDE